MSTIKTCILRHAVLTYFALVLAISWGSALVILGPGVFLGTKAYQ